MTAPFNYPLRPHVRRHGPREYVDYLSFRPWLRDEFSFRCVYCLLREQWGRVRGSFDIDHLQPAVVDASRTLDYANLLYYRGVSTTKRCAFVPAAAGFPRRSA